MPILTVLSEDIWVIILYFLEPPDILQFAKTCKYIYTLASVRVVWIQAAQSILSRGYPFPDGQIDAISTPDLAKLTTSAFLLGKRWRAGLSCPRREHNIASAVTSGMISDLRFIPGHGGSLVAIISKSVWSSLSIWDISGRMISEWSPRGSIFTGFCVNTQGESEATIVVSLYINQRHLVKVLTVAKRNRVLTELGSMETPMVAVTLTGDLIALSDHRSQTLIWDWRNNTYAQLGHSVTNNDNPFSQSNHCDQVLFVSDYIFVACARSVYLFRFPNLSTDRTALLHEPLAQHSFGWVDTQSMSACGGSVSILVRGEIDDPWTSTAHIHKLFNFTLNTNSDVNSDQVPFIFPPQLIKSVDSLRGSLRCKRVVLGPLGTALWIQPRNHFAVGLLADTQHQVAALPGNSSLYEALVAVAFSSTLSSGCDTPDSRKIYENRTGTDWSAFDYDETGGRVAIASSFGPVKILYL